MFRPAGMPRDHASVARYLGKLPSGSCVRLGDGGVYVKFVRRWMVDGVVGYPTTSSALAILNGNAVPTLLPPAWHQSEVTP